MWRSPFRSVAVVMVLVVIAVVACTSGGSRTATPPTTVASTPTAGGDADVALPPPPAPIAVGLRRTGTPVDPNVGDSVLIGGFSISEAPAARVELWDGDELVAALAVDDGANELETAWEWTPDAPGIHALVARGYDAHGRSATSFPLWVRVREPDRSVIQSLRNAEPVSLASATPDGIDGGCVTSVTVPPQDGVAGIAVYASSFGAPGFVPIDLLPPSGGTSTIPVLTVPILVYTEAFSEAATDPAPPQLILPPNPCVDLGWSGLHLDQGLLDVSQSATAAYLYVSYDSGVVWDRVPASDQEFVGPDVDGRFDFSTLLEAAQPSLTFEAWGLVDGQPAPLGAGSFDAPYPPTPPNSSPGPGALGSGVAFAGPNVAAGALDWVLEGGMLVRQGVICTYPPQQSVQSTPPPVPVQVAGSQDAPSAPTTAPAGPVIAVLPDHCTNAPLGGYSKTFRWDSKLPGATHGLLQVSTLPPPSGAALSYPGLILTKQVPEAGGSAGDFEIDVVDISNEVESTLTANEPGGVGYAAALEMAGLGAASVGSPTPPVIGLQSTPSLYLRVIPMLGVQPLPGASNTVVVDFDDTPPAKPTSESASSAISLSLTMTPPRLPNPLYQRCVRVLSNPFPFGANPVPTQTPGWFEARGETPPAVPDYPPSTYSTTRNSAFTLVNGAEAHTGLVPGSTVCAWQPTPSSDTLWDYIEDAVNFVSSVWDMYVDGFNWIKTKIVQAVAKFSGCTAAVEKAGTNSEDATFGCEALASIAMKAALTAIGIPPTLPKYSEVVAAAKQDLATLIVEAGAQSGVLDCGTTLQSTCEEVAQKLVEKLIEETGVQLSNALLKVATSGGNGVLAIHPGISVIPEPAGILSPAVFEIEITRSSDPTAPSPPSSCSYTGQVSGAKSSYQWHDDAHGVDVVGPVAAGAVMVPKTIDVDLSELAPGESTTAVIVLEKLVAWYLPGQNPQFVPLASAVKPSTWIFMTHADSTLTTHLIGSPGCGSAYQDHAQDSQSTSPEEIVVP